MIYQVLTCSLAIYTFIVRNQKKRRRKMGKERKNKRDRYKRRRKAGEAEEGEEEKSNELPLSITVSDTRVPRKQASVTVPQTAMTSPAANSLESRKMLVLTLDAKLNITFWPLG